MADAQDLGRKFWGIAGLERVLECDHHGDRSPFDLTRAVRYEFLVCCLRAVEILSKLMKGFNVRGAQRLGYRFL